MAADTIEADLRDHGARLRIGTPPDLIVEVLARLADEPAPVRGGTARVLGARLGRWARARWRALVVFVVACLFVGGAVSPVGAQVADWFGFGGVKVSRGSLDTVIPAGGVPTGQPVGLTEAEALVGFDITLPTALGPPDSIVVSADRRVASLLWTETPDGPLRLDQFDGTLSWVFVKKYVDDAQFTNVGPAEAVWFAVPHPLVYIDAAGVEHTESARMAAQTLVWQVGTVTYRLEGELTLPRARTIAESLA